MKIKANRAQGRYQLLPEYGDKKYVLMIEENGEYYGLMTTDTMQDMATQITSELAAARVRINKEVKP